MPIENRNLQIGTKLTGKYHKQPYECEVVAGEGGKVRFRFPDGREFKSPSAAGMAITQHACDGWTFWSVAKEGAAAETETVAPPETAEARAIDVSSPAVEPPTVEVVKAHKAKVERVKPPKTGIYRLPNQKGAPAGMTRYYCFDCSNPFPAPSSEKHPVCPNQHSDKK